ncbi:hypothetical protein K458DRAFT_466245 [Lentithecium fluviatile CBS 122367]|uniref:Heterokaryon incompatibility domain-containing protein n=1 Tax=Lentithecium fluviatile CBS 122367 TaxID=1168545 RepID=A0A6G1IHS2_9PLEO|nr:hypothetical protein K458DRAFT_466245 [Lentithecium fluviatile CBS 122367]
MRIWPTVVYMYSHLQLTKSQDKLPACAELAKLVASPDGQYLAGLWKSTLLEDLYWIVQNSFSGDLRPRPTWRAPSWSWASVDGPIVYLGRISRTPTSWRHDVELVDYEVIPKGVDKFGQLESGTLCLRGRCTPITWIRTESRMGMDGLPMVVQDLVRFPNGSTYEFNIDIEIGSMARSMPGTLRRIRP